MFILTDAQIVNNVFLVFINDILSSGWIPELFAKDELDGILGKVRNAAKSAGVEDAPGPIFNFFIDQVRRNLHMALCMSPVGDTLRVRARMFPALINCTSIDWFFEWPQDALIGVAEKFLAPEEVFPDDDRPELPNTWPSVTFLSTRLTLSSVSKCAVTTTPHQRLSSS